MEIMQQVLLLLSCVCLVLQAEGRKTYRDIFPHKHPLSKKFPYPIPHIPIPGWDPDSNPWNDYMYPPIKPSPKLFMNQKEAKPTVRLTSDSPALNGSCISFTAKLEYPPCQKEDANGDLVWDKHCGDANGQVRSGFVYNWTSWMDDYGFGKCTDKTKCNVFPDGKPFLQNHDWRHKSYVYVWHTMGQYYETTDGSSSSLTINTSIVPLGAEVMEVMVYRKRDSRKYTPLSTDNTVFYVTDKIPLAVEVTQKAAINQSRKEFFRGEDVIFQVTLHDPSGFLKTAHSIDYIWDFRDGNQLVTHREVTTHNYNSLGNMTVKLVVEAAFPTKCPPPTKEPPTPPSVTHAATVKMDTTRGPRSSSRPRQTLSPTRATTRAPSTEPLPPLDTTTPGFTLPWLHNRQLKGNKCFHYAYGTFSGNITIIEPKHILSSKPSSRIVNVSAARVTKTDYSFLVKCMGSIPTSACTIVSDPTCTRVSEIMCDDVPPTLKCEVQLMRTFLKPGTYCVNITLEDSTSLAFASTTVTINKSQDKPVSKNPNRAGVVVSTSAALVGVFAFIAYMVYKRYKVYRPIHRSLVMNPTHVEVRGHAARLKESLFPSSEESRHLLTE